MSASVAGRAGWLGCGLALVVALAACDGDGTDTTSSANVAGSGGAGGVASGGTGGLPTGGGGAGGGTPDPVGVCEVYCAHAVDCAGEDPACLGDCVLEASYATQLGDVCSAGFESVLSCASLLSCDELAEHLSSSGATGACSDVTAAYLGLAACAPPAVCDDACAVLLACDPMLTETACRFACAIDIRTGEMTVSGACGELQKAYFACVAGATCSALDDGSACAPERDAIADCL
ncbi:MAG: hypothetical protein R3B70_04855 [Polyangiaceae bacterium]